MAICLRGMTHAETTLLTRAMAASGQRAARLVTRDRGPAPCSTSIPPAASATRSASCWRRSSLPVVRWCRWSRARPRPQWRHAGQARGFARLPRDPGSCGTAAHAARRRLRDRRRQRAHRAGRPPPLRRSATPRASVESLPLITASILSKKLAAGVQRLLIDVKLGNGAFCTRPDEARAGREPGDGGQRSRAADTRVDHRHERGARNQRGQCPEVRESLAFLTNRAREPRLLEVTPRVVRPIAAARRPGGQPCRWRAPSARSARQRRRGRAFCAHGCRPPAARATLARGEALLPRAQVQRPLPSPRDGVVGADGIRAPLAWR